MVCLTLTVSLQMTRILLVFILIGSIASTYRHFRQREGRYPPVRYNKHSLTSSRLEKSGVAQFAPPINQRRRRRRMRRRLGGPSRRNSDFPVMSRQLGIELRDERRESRRSYSNFFETGNLNSIRLTPIKKGSSTGRNLLHNYPRYTSWNKYRISQVTTTKTKII